jgi:transposase InsO family protein
MLLQDKRTGDAFYKHLRHIHKSHRKRYGSYECRGRIKRDKPQALSVPLSINQTWSIDFMSDSLNTGRKIRTFNAIDDYNRECLGIEVDHFLPAQRVIQSLEQLIEWRSKHLKQ